MVGKIMSISDVLMWRYYELLSFKPIEVIEGYKTDIAEGKNPRDVKIDLAKELIERFHSKEDAEVAHQEFINRFQKGAMPDEMPEVELTPESGSIGIANLLKEAGLVSSTSDAFRMIKQGAAKIEGEKITDKSLVVEKGTKAVYQVGKRKFARVSVN
jgi:tyrosyl-tRNA synthetase